MLILFRSLFGVATALALLSPPAHAANAALCPTGRPENAAFAKIGEGLQASLKRFANDPKVARDADALLSKLVAAKGPAIMDWMSKHAPPGRSEDDIIHDWREYYAKNFVLSKYPQPQAEVNALIDALVLKTYQSALPEAERARLRKIFKQSKTAALKTLAGFGPAAAAARARLEGIELVFLEKLSGSPFAKNPLEAIFWGVAYDAVPNRINIGIDARQYTSDATLFAVFAHELGHSFDPCRWSAFFKGPSPFASVVSCLRGSESAHARSRDDSKLDEFLRTNQIGTELHASLVANPTCNKLEYPPVGLQSDQSLEAFADWFSAEVTAQATDVPRAGLRADLCEERKLNEGSAYPTNSTRLERIYFAHPTLRKAVGLNEKGAPPYCAYSAPNAPAT